MCHNDIQGSICLFLKLNTQNFIMLLFIFLTAVTVFAVVHLRLNNVAIDVNTAAYSISHIRSIHMVEQMEKNLERTDHKQCK